LTIFALTKDQTSKTETIPDKIPRSLTACKEYILHLTL